MEHLLHYLAASAQSKETRILQFKQRLFSQHKPTSFFIQGPQGRTTAYRRTRRSRRKNDHTVPDTLMPFGSSATLE
ncbi:uncharacterized protein LOC143769344 isoform X2 [Ranitomeya variabilis]|uniref:uncharacterized protein LOC143769344 isoform X2 n=1 Tax=Ranitomeya variabilis TaxID=490064 RepID=UPI0040579508